jgi:hypothetical protein
MKVEILCRFRKGKFLIFVLSHMWGINTARGELHKHSWSLVGCRAISETYLTENGAC